MNPEFKHDLNVWVTSFLDYGRWGNDGDYIQSMVYAAAERAHGKDMASSELARDHVEGVLRRAGKSAEEASRVSDDVREIIHTIHNFMSHGDRGEEYLEHRKDMELDDACDPASDPRFAKPPRHLKFQNSEAWLCATDVELDEVGVGLPDRGPNGACPFLHRTDGPALRAFTQGGKLFEELWFENGECHRDGAPAWVWYGEDGSVEMERWYTRGNMTAERDDR